MFCVVCSRAVCLCVGGGIRVDHVGLAAAVCLLELLLLHPHECLTKLKKTKQQHPNRQQLRPLLPKRRPEKKKKTCLLSVNAAFAEGGVGVDRVFS